MRGLPFPTDVQYDPEPLIEQGNTLGAHPVIPIDPLLGGPAIVPVFMPEQNSPLSKEHVHTDHPVFSPESMHCTPEPRQISQEPRHYSQGPQGDPFAPPPVFIPLEEEQASQPLPKPMKRKRRPRREEECGFCQGDGLRGDNGEPEPLMTCSECGRSGHRSCLQLGEVSDLVLSYAWKCLECKNCEVCHEKGDDERILFCDSCDRGWHMDCLRPPLAESPPGKWHCPLCPPVDSMSYPPLDLPPTTSIHSASPTSRGKGRAPSEGDELDAEGETDVDAPLTPVDTAPPKPRKKRKKRKPKIPDFMDDDFSDFDIPVPPPPKKKQRLRVHSPAPPPAQVAYPRVKIRLRIPGKGKAREEEERKGLFDDILSVEDRDTTKTTVEATEKLRFERSRAAAEAKLAPPAPPLPPPLPLRSPSYFLDAPETPGPSTRPLRSSALSHLPPPILGASASPGPSTPGGATATAPAAPQTLRIRTIRFGDYDIQTWYDAPFPEEYANIPDGRLWICEFCLKYVKSRFGSGRHQMKCKSRHPPGDEIYRDGSISIFEVDGRKNKIYCQNLCLLSKMFLDHKSLFYDVEPFLFYVMTEVDDFGARFVGYFSKEKRSPKDYNVSCIMTLPVRQRQGWGNLLIDFSYLLSKKEGRVGSPEKPLSSLGALGYRNYWTLAVMRYLENAPPNPRLEDISAATSMTIEDVCTTLTQQSMLYSRATTPPIPKPSPGQSIKFPKGRKNGIARRHHLQRTQSQKSTLDSPTTSTADDGHKKETPFVPPTEYEIRWDAEKVRSWLVEWERKKYGKLKLEKLKWSPFLLARMKKTEAEGAIMVADLEKKKDVEVEVEVVADGDGQSGQGGDLAETLNTDGAIAAVTPASEADLGPDYVLPTSILPSAPEKRLTSAGNEPWSPSPSARQPFFAVSAADVKMDEDEALAAKLALEERRADRQLRPRSRSTVPARIEPSMSPKKRRMAGELDEVSAERKEREESPPKRSRDCPTMTPMPGQRSRKASVVKSNGRGPAQGNGDVSGHLNGTSDDGSMRMSISAETPIAPILHIDTGVELMGDDDLDFGSPLTGLTSRQSMPRDDPIGEDAFLPANGVIGEVHLKAFERLEAGRLDG